MFPGILQELGNVFVVWEGLLRTQFQRRKAGNTEKSVTLMQVDYAAPVFPSIQFMAESLQSMYYIAEADETTMTLAEGYVFVSYFDLLLEPTPELMAEYHQYMKEQELMPFATDARTFKYLQISRMAYYSFDICDKLRHQFGLKADIVNSATGLTIRLPEREIFEWIDKAETINRIIPQWLKISKIVYIDLDEDDDA